MPQIERLMRAVRQKWRDSPWIDEAMVLLLAAPSMEPCAPTAAKTRLLPGV
jgi:hypothetical protein